MTSPTVCFREETSVRVPRSYSDVTDGVYEVTFAHFTYLIYTSLVWVSDDVSFGELVQGKYSLFLEVNLQFSESSPFDRN